MKTCTKCETPITSPQLAESEPERCASCGDLDGDWTDALVALNACDEAVTWARTQPDLATAWAVCDRGDWMLWLAGRVAGPLGDPRRRPLVGAASACARLAEPLYRAWRDDSVISDCLDAYDVYAAGGEEVNLAAEAARAARAARAAEAAEAAEAARAARAARAAGAAWAAWAAGAAEAAEVAGAATLAQCADVVRVWYPAPPVLP